MSRKSEFGSFFPAALAFLLLAAVPANAQGQSGLQSRILITQNIDEEKRVTLKGNTRPEARAQNDRGAVADDFPMEHILLQLRRAPEIEKALQQFIDELHTPGSPNFHRWINAQEFGARFGPPKPDLDTVTRWLASQGFRVNVVYPSGMVIDFSGTATQVRKAFESEIHHFEVKGEKHVANASDPRIPAALASVVSGVVSLHDFKPHSMHHMRRPGTEFTFPGSFGSTSFAIVPADLATIYNLNPLFNAGNSGQGQTIVLIEDTDVFTASDWTTFRSTFGLSGYTSASFAQGHPRSPTGPNNCGAPGTFAHNSATEATHGIAVNAFASTPNNVAVGGTDFSDTYSGTSATYWNSSNTSAFGSAISYVPEIPWNDSCAGALLSTYLGYSLTYGSTSLCNDPLFGSLFETTVAGGSGPSGCATGTPSASGVVSGTCQGLPKPSWQSVLG